jgi:hypothetical protein
MNVPLRDQGGCFVRLFGVEMNDARFRAIDPHDGVKNDRPLRCPR